MTMPKSGGGSFTVWLSLSIFNANKDTEIFDANNDGDVMQNEVGEDETQMKIDMRKIFSGKRSTNRMTRSLELVEEYPPESTYRSLSRKAGSLITTIAPTSFIPQPPTADAMTESKNRNIVMGTSGVTTISPDVEIIDTTTEDYGGFAEPNCDYDAITFIIKCGLNIITSIFGLSDTCCKPLF